LSIKFRNEKFKCKTKARNSSSLKYLKAVISILNCFSIIYNQDLKTFVEIYNDNNKRGKVMHDIQIRFNQEILIIWCMIRQVRVENFREQIAPNNKLSGKNSTEGGIFLPRSSSSDSLRVVYQAEKTHSFFPSSPLPIHY